MNLVLTQSAISAMWDCQELYRLTYEEGLTPISYAPRALWLGSLVHDGLDLWHKGGGLEAALERIAVEFSKAGGDRDDLCMARALLRGYVNRNHDDSWIVVGSEIQFSGELINPATGHHSRRFTFAGKADLMVRLTQDLTVAKTGQRVLVEHKTSGPIDGGYIEKIWTDLQLAAYLIYLGSAEDPIASVLYNVLAKPKLQRLQVNSRRSEPESDEAFESRLFDKILDEPNTYGLRHEVAIDTDRLNEVKAQLWRTAQMILEARRSGVWIKNTRHCHANHGTCRFYSLCSAPEEARDFIFGNQFQKKAPHEELQTTGREEIF